MRYLNPESVELKKPAPVMVYLDIGNICPCSVGCLDNEHKDPEVHFELVKGTLEELASVGVKFLTLKGEDLFFREEIWKIIEKSMKLGFELYLFMDNVLRRMERDSFGRGLNVQRYPIEYKRQRYQIFRSNRCTAGYASCNITPCRYVTPCSYLQIMMGDLRESNFIQIWESFSVEEFLSDREEDYQCKRCLHM